MIFFKFFTLKGETLERLFKAVFVRASYLAFVLALLERFCLGVPACSEIGLKWFLFAFHDLRKLLDFVSVLHFFEQLSS
jgi:hypothetical protein